MLSAEMPIMTCTVCGYEYFDERGERAQHEAVCQHLGVLSPGEIIAIRQTLGLTRSSFAELAGVGDASLQRWESGTLIQNKSIDLLLYLLQFKESRRYIEQRAKHQDLASVDSVDDTASESVPIAMKIGFPEKTVIDLRVAILASDGHLQRDALKFTKLFSRNEIFQPAFENR